MSGKPGDAIISCAIAPFGSPKAGKHLFDKRKSRLLSGGFLRVCGYSGGKQSVQAIPALDGSGFGA